MVLSDDMKTPQGIVEGTPTTFCNSWKTNLLCQNKIERLDDPCSLSVENGKMPWMFLIIFFFIIVVLWIWEYVTLNFVCITVKDHYFSCTLRELCQTLVCVATKSKQRFRPVPFSGGSWHIPQGTVTCSCLSSSHYILMGLYLYKHVFCPVQRCLYASCNCEKSEACLCAVFSSYARVCASKGVFLTDWRENVCGTGFFLLSCGKADDWGLEFLAYLTCLFISLKTVK